MCYRRCATPETAGVAWPPPLTRPTTPSISPMSMASSALKKVSVCISK